MENELKKLRESMTGTVLKNVNFDKKVQLEIFKRIRKTKTSSVSFLKFNIKNPLFWIITPLVSVMIYLSFNETPNVIANLFTNNSIHHLYDDYLIHNGYYYIPLNEEVSKEELSNKIGNVSRNGEWNFLKEGDIGNASDYYGSSYYSLKKYPDAEYLAIEVKDPTVKEGNGEVVSYNLLKRVETIEEIDSTTIYNTKNDQDEIQITLNNIRNKVSFVHEFNNRNLIPFYSELKTDGLKMYIKLGYKNPQKNSLLWLTQYESGYKIDQDYKTNIKMESFSLQNINWDVYTNSGSSVDKENIILIGTKENTLFQIVSEGFSIDEIKAYLNNLEDTGIK